jgi:hypothetical protein
MDTVAREPSHELASLKRLRKVPFVRDLKYTHLKKGRDLRPDGALAIKTPHGLFRLWVEAKGSFLPSSAVPQLIAWLNQRRTDRTQGVMLLAGYVSRPAAEALIEAKVNFADDAGNIHLELGDAYNWTAIGIPPPAPISERRPSSPAQLQLLFQFITHPESVNWPVRRLEPAAGISKSKAAQARRQMVAEGLLTRAGKQYKLGPTSLLADRLVLGYAQVLRPKLTLGSFRPAEKTMESFLGRLAREVPPDVRYSLSGAPAADLLQHFYRGPEITLFLEPSTRAIAQQLRLLPDRDGPVTILRAFGELVFWEQREHQMLAPPWLIYAELLNSKDPRAHEAAQEIRTKLLV